MTRDYLQFSTFYTASSREIDELVKLLQACNDGALYRDTSGRYIAMKEQTNDIPDNYELIASFCDWRRAEESERLPVDRWDDVKKRKVYGSRRAGKNTVFLFAAWHGNLKPLTEMIVQTQMASGSDAAFALEWTEPFDDLQSEEAGGGAVVIYKGEAHRFTTVQFIQETRGRLGI